MSLSETAYDRLRMAIREGRFQPGDRLGEADVSEWLGVSRTPVREALRRLASEGLLVRGPWNGMRVIKLDQQQVVELYAVREMLEGAAARLAAQNASDAEIQRIRAILEREENEQRNPGLLAEINADLHWAIYRSAHNRYLMEALGDLADILGILRSSNFVVPGSAQAAHEGHIAIVRAIEQRNPAAAESAAREHILESLHNRLKHMERHEQTAETFNDPQPEAAGRA
jgi:DNA-binding GntR family transcriptional regulator